MLNNPYVPGDPYSYDLKWLVARVKEILQQLGTLDEAIEKKIFEGFVEHSIVQFHNVADMLAADIKDGNIVLTLGYHEAGDLGAMFYLIKDFNPGQCALDYFLTMDNNAQIAIPVIVTPYVTPEMFGAKGDGTTDDTLAIKTAFDMSKTVFVINDYAVMPESDGAAVVEIDTPHTVTGGGSLKILPNGFDGYNIFYVTGEDVTIENVTLIGDKDTHTGSTGEHGNLLAIYGKKVRVENVKCKKAWGDGIYIRNANNVHVDGVTCDGNRRNAISVTAGSAIFIENSAFINTSGTAPEAGIAIEANLTTDLIDCRVVNCIATGNAGTDGFYATVRANNSSVLFDHVTSDKAYSVAFYSGTGSRIEANGCRWHERDSRGAYIVRMETLDNYPIFRNNDINADGSSTVIYQLGAGLSNLYVEGDIVRNGSLARPALWLGTRTGDHKHVSLDLINCSFSSPGYPWYYTSDRLTEYLEIKNDEVAVVTAAAGYDYVHNNIIVPSSSSMAQDTTLAQFDLYPGQKVHILNNGPNRLIVSSSQLIHTPTVSSNSISINTGAAAILETVLNDIALQRLPN